MVKHLSGGAALLANGSGLGSSTAGGADGSEAGFILVGYRGTFQFGRDGLADVKFRKISRILVSGRVSICREVFGDEADSRLDLEGHLQTVKVKVKVKVTVSVSVLFRQRPNGELV